jgi:hypothetical protein
VAQSAVLAGTGRAMRLSYRERSEAENSIIDSCTGFGGPLLFLFCWWVLQEATRRKLDRLYFLARDGQIILNVARSLVDAWQIPIELKYLYCSRESLFLPSFREMGEFEVDWTSWGFRKEISLAEICRRVDVEFHEVEEVFAEHGLKHLVAHPEDLIRIKDRPKVEAVLRNKKFSFLVREKAKHARQFVLAYLAQEGLQDNVPFALVDTGWRGSSQFALSRLLYGSGREEGKAFQGLYLGLGNDVYCAIGDSLTGFLFDWRKGKVDDRIRNFLCFEMLCSSAEGRTMGYGTGEKGRLVPRLGQALDEPFRGLVNLQHDLVSNYAAEAALHFKFDDFKQEEAKRLCRKLAKAFIGFPDEGQARVYGEWPMACEVRERDRQVMAPPMDFFKFIKCTLGREKVQGYWPQASLRRGGATRSLLAYNFLLASGALDWLRKAWLKY